MKKLILILLLSLPAYSQTGWLWQNSLQILNEKQSHDVNFGLSVGDPKIVVSDIDFGTRYVPDDTIASVRIVNIGTSDLYIGRMQGPKSNNNFIVYIKDFDNSNPIIIAPYAVFQFNVRFHPQENTIYNDTIFFFSNSDQAGDFDNMAVLSGIGKIHIGPIINVSDADFGCVYRYTKKNMPITIRNDGDSNLCITDYQLPMYYLFEPEITQTISKNNPLIIQPGNSWSFNVVFSAPDITCNCFNDKIIFNSNAVSGDSIALLEVDSVVIADVDNFSNNINEFKISPNPFTNQITFEITGNDKAELIIIYDLFGRAVQILKTQFLDSGKTHNITIKTKDLPKGVYFVRLHGSFDAKLIVKSE